jgi:hypothetical protein
MTEQSARKVVVTGQLSSPWAAIDEQPVVQVDQPVINYDHRPPVETLTATASPQSDGQLGRSLGQILIVLVVLLVLVNMPISFHGAGLAQIVPEATAVVMVDGMLLKGSGPETYVLEDHKLRLISGPEVFDYYFLGYNVHRVDDKLLEDFGKGQSIHWLVTCPNSPYIYALEQGQKRLVKDPPARNKAKPWDEVRLVSCGYLGQLPEGSPIPSEITPVH